MATVLYEYFKKELEEGKILVRINPETYEGLELLVDKNDTILQTRREFDEMIYDDLAHDDFIDGSAMEFNLFLSKIKE